MRVPTFRCPPGLASCLATLLISVAVAADNPLTRIAEPDLAALKQGFLKPVGETRVRVLDAIPRGGWDLDNMLNDLRLMQVAGLGGFAYLDGYEGHGQIYGDITVFPEADQKSDPFMSPGHLKKMNRVLEEAQRRDMRILAPIRAMYFSGGPWITQDLAQKEYTLSKTFVSGAGKMKIVLPEPQSRDADAIPQAERKKYYRDAFVVAWPVKQDPRQTAMYRMKPKITVSDPESNRDAGLLADANPFSAMSLNGVWLLPAGPKPAELPKPTAITYEFREPFNADTCFIKLAADRAAVPVRGKISSSSDGRTFEKLADFDVMMGREGRIALPGSKPARWYRLDFPSITNRDTIGIGEIEFLEPGEQPVTKETILNFDQKADRACWDDSLVTKPAEYWGSKVFYQTGKVSMPDQVIHRSEVVDLTSKLKPDGTLDWDVPAGNWCVMRIGYTVGKHSFTSARRGGAGYECDLFDPRAARLQYENVPHRILGALSPEGRQALQGFWFESLETGQNNWTPRMGEEFKKFAGYDISSWLPVLADQIVDGPLESDAFLADFRRTLNLLFAENHHGVLKELCEKDGLQWVSETGGSKQSGVDALLYLSRTSMPMGEFWGGQEVIGFNNTVLEFHGRSGIKGPNPWWSSDAQVKLPASVSHTYGNSPLVAMETLTGMDFDFHRVPVFDKHVTDRAFCTGANQLYISWWPNDDRPGVFPGLHHWGWITPRNTIFRESKAFLDYISRCQSLLQRGRFQADVLITQENSFHLRERTASQDWPKVFAPKGYDFDFLSRELLLDGLKVKDGALVLPSGMSYRVLQIPAFADRLSVEGMKKIEALLQAGAIILAPKPEAGMAGLDYISDWKEHQKLVERIWSGLDGKRVTSKAYGKGRLYCGAPIEEVLQREGVRPDFSYQGQNGTSYIDHIHRRLENQQIDFYFLANSINQATEVRARFRGQGGKTPHLFDPLTGKIQTVVQYTSKDGDMEIPLHFEPIGSLFVVFSNESESTHIDSIAPQDMGNAPLQFQTDARGQLTAQALTNGEYELRSSRGEVTKLKVENVPATLSLAGPWQVDFKDMFGGTFQREFPELKSFSVSADQQVKYFSGEATYHNHFTLPADATEKTKWYLEAGQVRWLAEVRINGHKAGIVWCPPWRLEITEFCQPGENTIELICANPWKNRLIGESHLPAGERKAVITNFRTGIDEFKKMPLMEAGLLGPIKIVPAAVIPLKL